VGARAELEGIARTLAHGASYQRQRRIYAATGSLPAVVDALIQELARDEPAL
jgi:gamma-glutamyl:cysteine ligase YbdK (ATP-grasp superfamily)